jgi:UDP-N-acetylmuramate: L-alanyl-gamma-D-glutamyl-meso-diaminopimelate ligase
VLERGCWTPVEHFASSDGWEARDRADRDTAFDVYLRGQRQSTIHWNLLGEHNRQNALAAIAAARHAGVPVSVASEALHQFRNVRRRMELRGVVNGISVYDDFAHHPTAIRTTLAGLRAKVGASRILAVLEPRSNSMKLGVWAQQLAPSLSAADQVFCYSAQLGWDVTTALASLGDKLSTSDDLPRLIAMISAVARPGDHILIMSNGGFGGIHDTLLASLRAQDARF